ncbi:MAG: WD40 repeat domain-containing protein, partial [Chloroflexota bacterium]
MDLSDPPGSEPNPGEIDRSRLLLALLFVLAAAAVVFALVQQTTLREVAGARATAEAQAATALVESEPLRRSIGADQLIAEFEHEEQILTASLSPDARLVATAGDEGIPRIWDAETGDLLAELSGHADPVRVAHFSPDGSLLVTADDDGGAELWDGVTFENLAHVEAHISAVRAAGFSPDGATVLTAGDDGLARTWGISIEEPGATTLSAGFDLEDRVGRLTSAAFSPDGKRILTAGSDGLARLWDGRTGAALADLDGHVAQINSAAFSPDGARAATADSGGVVRIWNLSTTPPGEPIILNAHGGPTYQAAFSPGGSLLITIGCDE